jgi:hypothetical protein
LNNQIATTYNGAQFTFSCGYDFGAGGNAAQGGVIADIVGLVAYSVLDCIDACSVLNFKSKQWEVATRCNSITFDTVMATTIGTVGGNCWLKNGSVAAGVMISPGTGVVSATLVT